MKIVLVHPAGSNWFPGQKDATVVANRMAPIGLLSMAAYIISTGRHDVFVHDCLGPKARPGPQANVKRILAHQPDLVGFTATTSAFPDANDMASLIKETRPDIKIIVGGVHASAIGAQLLEQFDSIDYLCLGEGEETLLELADGEDLGSINGLVWRDGEQAVTNPPRIHIKHLDELPFPAYDLLPRFPKGYYLPPLSYIHVPGATMITSRGCIYNCSYCDRSVFKKGFRSNTADYIYDHMKMLQERFNVRHINVYDDLFTTNRNRITQICEQLIDRPLGIQFNCAVHAGHADDDLLRMLKDAGCLMISVGIESGDAALMERHKASVTLDQVRDTVARIQENGIRAKGLFMMGLPGETPESIKKTSDFIISLGLDDMNMSKFTPFPGAPCWPTVHNDGTFDNDWSLMNCLNFVFVPKAFESREEIDELYNRHIKRFYHDKIWLKTKFKKRLWQHRHTLWRFIANMPSFLAAKRSFEPKSLTPSQPAAAGHSPE